MLELFSGVRGIASDVAALQGSSSYCWFSWAGELIEPDCRAANFMYAGCFGGVDEAMSDLAGFSSQRTAARLLRWRRGLLPWFLPWRWDAKLVAAYSSTLTVCSRSCSSTKSSMSVRHTRVPGLSDGSAFQRAGRLRKW